MRQPCVVVLRALGLGDFLTAVPALRGVAKAFPGHRRVLAAPRALRPLVELCGGVDELSHTPDLVPLDRSLAGAEVAIDLHGRGAASHDLLVDLGPSRLVAFADPRTPASTEGPRWTADEHEVHRWCRLLCENDIPADPSQLDLAVPQATVPRRARGATVVHPGAAAPARRWPASRFATVAAVEACAGRTVLVTAGPGEEALAEDVVARARAEASLLGAPSPAAVSVVVPGDLRRLAALVAAGGRVVCGDTGVAHLATALRTPSVVLFGPVPPAWWGPPAERWWHVPLWAGRHGDPHGTAADPGLLEIGVSDVLLALSRLPDWRVGPETVPGPADGRPPATGNGARHAPARSERACNLHAASHAAGAPSEHVPPLSRRSRGGGPSR